MSKQNIFSRLSTTRPHLPGRLARAAFSAGHWHLKKLPGLQRLKFSTLVELKASRPRTVPRWTSIQPTSDAFHHHCCLDGHSAQDTGSKWKAAVLEAGSACSSGRTEWGDPATGPAAHGQDRWQLGACFRNSSLPLVQEQAWPGRSLMLPRSR